MAATIPLDDACRQIDGTLRRYASEKGWLEDDYVLLVHPSRWDSVHVFLAAKAYRDEEGFAERDGEILDYLETHVPDASRSIGMLHTESYERYRRMSLGDHVRWVMEHPEGSMPPR